MARLILVLLVCVTGALVFTRASHTSTYRYFGLRWLAVAPAVRHIRLDSSRVNIVSHVAVYIGAENHEVNSWVQGGVFRDGFDGRPQAYIEIKHYQQYSLRHWPVAYGENVRVVLSRLGSYWQIAVTVGSTLHVSRFIQIRPRAYVAATGELLGDAAGSGHIDTRFLRS